MGGRGAGGGWEAQRHEDFRVGVILGGVGTEINRVLMMMMMEAHGQFLMSFCPFSGLVRVDCKFVVRCYITYFSMRR